MLKVGHLACAMAALSLSLVATVLIPAEYRAFRLLRAAMPDQVATIAADKLPNARSVYGQRAEFMACDAALTGSAAALYPATLRDAAARTCLRRADASLEQAPGWSLPHLVRAVALDRLEHGDAAGEALLASLRSGPAEGWIAERRFELASASVHLPAQARAQVLQADIALLAGSEPGRVLLADRYVRRPELRDLISDIMITAEPSDQNRFLSAVARQRSGR